MKIIVGTLIAFLFGSVLVSKEAEARCWWNGYNHCSSHRQVYQHRGYYKNHGYYNHGHYNHAWNRDYRRHDYWYR
jgi:hypothetical protein